MYVPAYIECIQVSDCACTSVDDIYISSSHNKSEHYVCKIINRFYFLHTLVVLQFSRAVDIHPDESTEKITATVPGSCLHKVSITGHQHSSHLPQKNSASFG